MSNQTIKMKNTVTIVGNGAIGLLLASYLSKSDHKVQLATRTKDAASLINNNGIFLSDLNGTTEHITNNIAGSHNSSEFPPADIAIILTKAYSTGDAIDQHMEHLKESKAILTLQNGLGNVEIIQNQLTDKKILAGSITAGAVSLAANHTSYRGNGSIFIAPVNTSMSTADSIRDLFQNAGIQCETSDDWQSVIWTKLYINAIINPITALYKVNNGEIAANKKLRKLAQEMSDEILMLLESSDIKINIKNPFQRIIKVCEMTSANNSSMLQDIKNGNRLELDAITGQILKRAEECNVPTPINSKIYHRLKESTP